MADLLGFTAISTVSLITLIIALRWPGISKIIIVALIIRIIILLIGHYITPLPDNTSDALGFERKAWDLAQNGFFNVLSNMSFNPFVFFPSLHAIPYSLFGRSILIGQSISLLFGIGTIFFSWKLSKILWDNNTANKVGWTLALFPSVVLYSVLYLREVYVSFFLILALYGAVSWVKHNNYKSIVLSLMGFIGASLFHGPMIVGVFIFVIFVLFNYLKVLFKSLVYFRINVKNLIIFLLFLTIIVFYLTNKITFQYLGTFENSIDVDFLLLKTSYAYRGDASWPEWTKATNGFELLYKAPVRSIYFVLSPFPWDVKKPEHLIGLFDSLLYLYLVFLILRNIKVIWKDRALRLILITLLFYILVYGLGVGNFGTALRHKSKFALMFIILAAPLIKNLIFKKNMYYNHLK